MRYIPEQAANDWLLQELVDSGRRPCSDAYSRASDKDLVHIFRELRLLRAAGCPPNRLLGNPEVDQWKGKCKGEHQRSTFYVLKAKPSGWRLYFCVPPEERREIVFLFAVNKKKNERDQEDFKKLCKLLAKLIAKPDATEPLFIPNR